MAFPFGGHPTLGRFLEWARDNGCTAEIKLRTHSTNGRPYKVLEITRAEGGHASIVNPDLQEHLAPSMVSYLQRRLGVKSPFPAMPEQPDAAEAEFVKEDGQPFDPPRRSE